MDMTGASRRQRIQALFFAAIMVMSMIAAGVGGLAGGVAAQTNLVVDDDFNNPDGDTNFSSVQNAVDNASDGDTISVRNGTYIEEVTIDKPLTVLSTGSPEETKIRLTQQAASKTGAPTVNILSAGVTFEGFTVQRNSTDDSFAQGIRISNGSETDGTVVVSSNIVENLNTSRTVDNGILVGDNSNGQTPANVVVRSNTVSNFPNGIGVTSKKSGDIVENITVVNNTLSNNQLGVGVSKISGGAGVASISVTKNNISKNGAGVYLFGTEDNNNILTFDNVNASNVTVTQNKIENNTRRPNTDNVGVVNNGTGELTATDNYWGSPNGPSAGELNSYNDGNQGAGISGNVEFTPWLDASPDNKGESFAPVTNGSDGQFATIQGAIDTASVGDSIKLKPGTYQESIDISTSQISIKGPNVGVQGTNTGERTAEAVINSTAESPAVLINSSQVTIDGIEIQSDGQDGVRLRNSTINDIAITNSRITEVDGSAYLRGGKSSGAGNGIQIQFTDDGSVDNTVSNISISRNLISGVKTLDSDARTLAIGINVLPRGNNITNFKITNNTITGLKPGESNDEEEARGISIDTHVTEANSENSEGGTNNSMGVVNGVVISGNNINTFSANASGTFEAAGITLFDDNADKTDIGVNNFQITSNTIENITNKRDGVPSSTIFIGGHSNLGGNHLVANNDLIGGAIVRSPTGTPGTDDALNATLNYYGDNATPGISGNIIYDPVLTTSIKNISTDSTPEIRQYGSYLNLSSDGSPIAVGFSAPPDGTAADLLGNVVDVPSNVYRYDNSNNKFVGVNGSYTPSTGEVLVIAPQESLDDETIIPIATDAGTAAAPDSVDVTQGWNLVATGATNDASAIAVADGGADGVIDDASLQVQPVQPGAPEASTGAFEGTWLFVDADGQLFTGYTEDQSPSTYSVEVLKPGTDKSK